MARRLQQEARHVVAHPGARLTFQSLAEREPAALQIEEAVEDVLDLILQGLGERVFSDDLAAAQGVSKAFRIALASQQSFELRLREVPELDEDLAKAMPIG